MTELKLPNLTVGDVQVQPKGMPVLLVWGNQEVSRFLRPESAKSAFMIEHYITKNRRWVGAHIFSWDGLAWQELAL
jgi:hypothetical protein